MSNMCPSSDSKSIPDGFYFFQCCDGEGHSDFFVARSFEDLIRRHQVEYYESIYRCCRVTQEHYDAITEFLKSL